jgi:hypothetical protein
MLKSTTAIMVAAAIAAAVTVLSAPAGNVDAGPIAKPVEVAMKACVNQPWPYLHCVGTEFGNPKVRLVVAERFAR